MIDSTVATIIEEKRLLRVVYCQIIGHDLVTNCDHIDGDARCVTIKVRIVVCVERYEKFTLVYSIESNLERLERVLREVNWIFRGNAITAIHRCETEETKPETCTIIENKEVKAAIWLQVPTSVADAGGYSGGYDPVTKKIYIDVGEIETDPKSRENPSLGVSTTILHEKFHALDDISPDRIELDHDGIEIYSLAVNQILSKWYGAMNVDWETQIRLVQIRAGWSD